MLRALWNMKFCMKAKYNVTLFYFGKFETQLHLFRTKKKGLLGGVVQAFFACLKEHSSLVHCGSTPCKTHIVQENVINCKILCLHNMQEYILTLSIRLEILQDSLSTQFARRRHNLM